MTTIPLARPLKGKLFQVHREYRFLLNSKSFKSILIGDSLMAGLHRYYKIWNNFFKAIDALNCGIGGDKVQSVLWQVQNFPISSTLKNAVILCCTNNLQQDSPEDIVDAIIEIGHCYKKQRHHINICIGGDKVQSVLWPVQNLPISSSLKNAIILCGTNNLQQDSVEDIVDAIIEIGHCFKK